MFKFNRKTINKLLNATDLLDTKIKSLYDTVIHKITPELEYSQTALQLHSVLIF